MQWKGFEIRREERKSEMKTKEEDNDVAKHANTHSFQKDRYFLLKEYFLSHTFFWYCKNMNWVVRKTLTAENNNISFIISRSLSPPDMCQIAVARNQLPINMAQAHFLNFLFTIWCSCFLGAIKYWRATCT